MKSIVLGDIHLKECYSGFLDNQVQTVSNIIQNAKKDHGIRSVIFLGDIFERRSPKPKELLAFHDLIEKIDRHNIEIIVIRGNHDAVNRMDTLETVLTIYPKIKLYNKAGIYRNKYGMIPHFENPETLQRKIKDLSDMSWIFGHFGYKGCIPYVSDGVFSTEPEELETNVCLGHIHTHNDYTNEKGNRVLLLGTPYGTCFSESGHSHYYGILDHDTDDLTCHPITHGLRFLTIPDNQLENFKDILDEVDWRTYLRIITSEVSLPSNQDYLSNLKEELGVEYLEVKFIPKIEHKKESFSSEEVVMSLLDDQVVEEYLQVTETDLDKLQLREAFQEIRNEHTQSND